MKKLTELFNKLVRKNDKSAHVYIETPRMILREIERADIDRLHEITSTPGFFYCYFDGTRQSVVNFVNRAIATRDMPKGKRSEYLLAVADKTTGQLIGHVSLENEKLVENYTHSVNFFIDPKCQSKGLGRESAVNLMRYALEDLKMPGFSVTIHPQNGPSLKVAMTEGYKKVGETTLNTTRGIEPRLVLILNKEDFYAQREKDKIPLLLPKKPSNDNGFCSFLKRTFS